MKKFLFIIITVIMVFAVMGTPVMAGQPQKVDYNPELVIVTLGSATMDGDLESGFVMTVSGTDDSTNVIDLDGTPSDPKLKDGMYGFTLKANAAQKDVLYAYFADKEWEDPDWYSQINQEINGSIPYFFLKAENGSYSLVDNFKYSLVLDPAVVTLDNDYPEGTYVYQGQLRGENNEPLNLKITLTVVYEASVNLAYVQENTELDSISGTIDDLKATFPASIPAWFDTAGYVIDSRITLSKPLPIGSEVAITRVGMYSDLPLDLDGKGPFWLTELLGAPRFPFTTTYNGAVEDYIITVTAANPNTTVLIESIIIDGDGNETVLADITLDVVVAP